MGIQGLLKALSPLILDEENGVKSSNIRQFANKSLAIDASSWLFKASYSCAERLVENSLERNGQPVDQHCEQIICRYFISRCDELLRHASIQRLYLVFDGKRCPLKDVTRRDREERRQKNLEEARRAKALGRKGEADEKYKACINIAPWMCTSVTRAIEKQWGILSMDGLSKPRVIPVLSPAEADAQLAKLCLDGICDAVVSEDSDILVYSAVTQTPFQIIYKLDRDNGSCDVITMDWLLTHFNRPNHPHEGSIRGRYLNIPTDKSCIGTKKTSGNEKRKPTNALTSSLMDMVMREGKQRGYGVRMFVQACILTGCDYAPSRLNGIGLVNSFALVKDFANRNGDDRFSTILRSLPSAKISSTHNADIKTPNAAVRDYEDRLARSEAAFFYHPVLDMSSREIVPLSNWKKQTDSLWPSLKRFDFELSFIGHDLRRKDPINNISSPNIKKKRKSSEEINASNTPSSHLLTRVTQLENKTSDLDLHFIDHRRSQEMNDKISSTTITKKKGSQDKNKSPTVSKHHSSQVNGCFHSTTRRVPEIDVINLVRKKDAMIPSTNIFSDFSCILGTTCRTAEVNGSLVDTVPIIDDYCVVATPKSSDSDISDDEDRDIIDIKKSVFAPSILNKIETLRSTSSIACTEQGQKRVLSRVSESFDHVTLKMRPSSLLDLTNSPSKKQKLKNNLKNKAVSSSSTRTTKSQIKTLSITSYFKYK